MAYLKGIEFNFMRNLTKIACVLGLLLAIGLMLPGQRATAQCVGECGGGAVIEDVCCGPCLFMCQRNEDNMRRVRLRRSARVTKRTI